MRDGSLIRTRSGCDLFVRDWGEGPPVLLLAGWAMGSDLWGASMLRLNRAGLRTIAYDRRGHGRSSDPGVIDYDLLADDLADVMAALDLTDCTVVAHSGAGGEVLRSIARHGDARLRQLILVGTTLPGLARSAANPEGIDPAMLAVAADLLESDLEGWIDANAEPFAPGVSARTIDWLAAMVLGCSRRLLVDYQRAIAAADFTEDLRALQIPLTVIHGDLDASAPLDLCGRRTASLAPRAELLVYEGVAHGPMVTHPDRLAHDIAVRARTAAGEKAA